LDFEESTSRCIIVVVSGLVMGILWRDNDVSAMDHPGDLHALNQRDGGVMNGVVIYSAAVTDMLV